MGPNKAVHLMFLSGGILLFLILLWTGDWIWGTVARNPNEFILNGVALAGSIAIGVAVYKNERIHGLATEVATELSKVTWPTAKETRAATIVVIVTAIIASMILGAFDAIWSWLTDRIYG